MPTYLQMLHEIEQKINAIGYIPFDFERYDLFEYLMCNLYKNYEPHYTIQIIPNYWKFVLEDIKKLKLTIT
jgi:hypothetical protein